MSGNSDALRRSWRPARVAALGAVLVVTAAALVGCGSSSASSGTTGGGVISTDASAALSKAYKGVGGDLSALTPVKPKSGVNFYAISCGQSSTSCVTPTTALMQAATAAGWSAHMADGKLSPAGFAAAIRQAIAGGANVIVPVGFDCASAQAAFKEAHDAGVLIVGGGGPDDCEPKLWGSERLWLSGQDGIPEWNTFGSLAADWSFGKTNGKVKAITLTGTTVPWGQWITDGFNNELKTLGSDATTVANVNVTDPEAANGSFVQKVTTALLAHPDATVLFVEQGGWLSNGLSQAIANTGRKDLTVVTALADSSTMDVLRSGSSNGLQMGAIAQAFAWGAWGSVDTAIRLLAGQKPVNIGESIQAVDGDKNLPTSGAYNGEIDWKSKFLASWGKA